MAPSEKAVMAALIKAVHDVFHSDKREELSVKMIRELVEEAQELEEGTLKGEEWKERVKETVKGEVGRLQDEEGEAEQSPEPVEKKTTPVKKKAVVKKDPVKKRAPVEKAKAPPRKRAKREETPVEESGEEGESDSSLSAAGSEVEDDSDESEPPKSKSKGKAVKAKTPETKAAVKKVGKNIPVKSQETADSENESDSALSPAPSDPPTKASAEKDIKANESDSSEMSVLLDGPATTKKTKTKSKPKSTSSNARQKPSTAKKTKANKPPAEPLSPDATQIKTLQSQLTKCGVRKIWAFELKACEDARSKIRHLQGLLKEVGMTGRFSDARAREIKEMRELAKDLEEVQEGDRSWGMDGGGGRARRSLQRGRKVVVESEDGDAGEGEAGDQGGDESADEVVKRPANGLIEDFLEDEDDSD